jgi:MoaA/NifB/PqqE/SkfB family radical SAM enzyme
MGIDFNSFKSAEIDYPEKLILNKTALRMLIDKKLAPIHVQLYPTNKCNLKCNFCSVADREKDIELDIEKIKTFFNRFNTIQSVSISGGGEPLLYSKIKELIDFLYDKNIKIGLVTNGYLFDKLDFETIKKLTWCRISLSEISNGKLINILRPYIDGINIDWAFSFVAEKDYIGSIHVIKNFYDNFEHRITHMRIVGNIIDDSCIEDIKNFFYDLKEYEKLIIQTRQAYLHGSNNCYLAVVKPVVQADGNIIACCGAQYATMENKRDCSKLLTLGNIDNLDKLFIDNYFNTNNVCKKCYYNSYNNFIASFFKGDMKHIEFI